MNLEGGKATAADANARKVHVEPLRCVCPSRKRQLARRATLCVVLRKQGTCAFVALRRLASVLSGKI